MEVRMKTILWATRSEMVSVYFSRHKQNALLTYSMEQSASWEANRFSASQEIPFILWNPKVHYRIHIRGGVWGWHVGRPPQATLL